MSHEVHVFHSALENCDLGSNARTPDCLEYSFVNTFRTASHVSFDDLLDWKHTGKYIVSLFTAQRELSLKVSLYPSRRIG